MMSSQCLALYCIIWTLFTTACSNKDSIAVNKRNALRAQVSPILDTLNRDGSDANSAGISSLPQAPLNLRADNTLPTSVSLAWDASVVGAHQFAIQSYVVYRDGHEVTQLANAALQFTDNGLTTGTIYSYSVVAIDEKGRQSPASLPLLVQPRDMTKLAWTYPTNGTMVPRQIQATLDCAVGAMVTISGDIAEKLNLLCETGIVEASIAFLESGAQKVLNAEQSIDGQTMQASVTISVNMLAPVLIVEKPLAFSVSGSNLFVSGLCTDGLAIYVSGSGISVPQTLSCVSGTYSASLALSAGDGDKDLSFMQTNAAGQTTEIKRRISKDTTPPVLTFISPAAQTATSGPLTITGTCESPLDVKVLVEGTAVATSNCMKDRFTQSIQLAGLDGNRVVTVSQTDRANLTGSASRTFALLTKLDGAALYTSNCASCHGALASSTKAGRTASQITAAISTVPPMQGLASLSGASIMAIAEALGTTQVVTPPNSPANLTATAKTYTTIDLAWNAAMVTTANATISSYMLMRNGQSIAMLSGTALNFKDTALTPATTYTYSVVAVDSNGKNSLPSVALSATTLTLNPIAITYPTANLIVGSSILVTVSCATGAQITISGNVVATASFPCVADRGETRVNLTAGAGIKTITASQLIEGLRSSVSRSVVLDDTSANLTVERPVQGAFVAASLTASGTCETGLPLLIAGTGLAAAQQTTCTNAVFSVALQLSAGDGVKALSFSQTDAVGNRAEVLRSVTKDTAAPIVSFTSPAASSETSGNLMIAGSCESPLTVSFKVDGLAAGSAPCTGGVWSSNVTLSGSDGLKTVLAEQRDQAGNLGSASRSFTLKAVLDGAALYTSNCASCHGALASSSKRNRTAAQISAAIATVPAMSALSTLSSAAITAIAGALSGGVVMTAPNLPANLRSPAKSYTTISLAWDAATVTSAGATIKSYVIYRNAVNIGTVSTTSFQDTGLAPATAYAYSIVAVDSNNLMSAKSATLSVTSSTLTPIVITYPTANLTVGTSVLVTMNCAATSQISLTGTITAPLSVVCTAAGTAEGRVTLTAGAGNKTISATQQIEGLSSTVSRIVVLDDKAANLTVERPAQGAVVSLSTMASGVCESGFPVKISGTGLAADQQFPCNSAVYSITLQMSAGDGAKDLIFSQTDAIGNRAEVLRRVTLDSMGPKPTFSSPAAGTVSTGALTISGTCEAPFAVAVKTEAGLAGSTACSTGTFSFALTLSGADGVKAVIIEQRDAAGNLGEATRTFTLQSTVNGEALYQTNCSNCHGTLAESSKKGRSASEITNAIQTIGAMATLKTLNAASIVAISDALAIPTTPPVSTAGTTRSIPLGTANYMTSYFTTNFGGTGTLTADDQKITATIANLVSARRSAFGGNCTRYETNCSAETHAITAELSQTPGPNPLRRGYAIRACSDILALDRAVDNALAKSGLTAATAFSTASVQQATMLLVRGRTLPLALQNSLVTLGQNAEAQTAQRRDGWRFIFYALCSSSIADIL